MEYRDEPVLSFRPIDAKESKPQNVRRLIRLHALLRIVAIACFAMILILFFLIRPVRVKSDAMSPAYPAGSVVFVTPEWGDPERGEIAAFTSRTDGSGEIYVRRVIAIERDTVEIRNGVLYVNEIAPDEPYLEIDPLGDYPDLPKTTVPEGCVFVLGDNRCHSEDSRNPDVIGMVDVRSILGVVRFAIGR